MKVVAVALLAIILSLLTVLGGIAVQTGGWPSGEDAMGFVLAIAVAGTLLVGALYWPVLARLRRRRAALTPARAAVVAGLGLNAPVYLLLAILGRDRSLFAGGETFVIGLAFAVIGLVFGAGYARTHRAAAA
jgi:hypothetical protein